MRTSNESANKHVGMCGNVVLDYKSAILHTSKTSRLKYSLYFVLLWQSLLSLWLFEFLPDSNESRGVAQTLGMPVWRSLSLFWHDHNMTLITIWIDGFLALLVTSLTLRRNQFPRTLLWSYCILTLIILTLDIVSYVALVEGPPITIDVTSVFSYQRKHIFSAGAFIESAVLAFPMLAIMGVYWTSPKKHPISTVRSND